MNRTEKIIVVVIGLLMIAWLFISPKLVPPAPAPDTGAAGPAIGVTNAQAETGPSMAPAATPDMASAAAEPAPAAAEPAESEAIAPRGPEQLFTLTNSDCALTFSSRGAGLVQVDFPNYRRFAGDTSSWVVIDQRLAPALVYTGLAGLGADADFRGAAAPDGASVTFERKSASGLALTRTITLDRRDVPPNRGIWARIKARSIESDETYRLKVVEINLPPLRERKEDIPLLVDALVSRAARENERPVPPVTPAAMKALLDHDWPGNVRELENVLERAVVLGGGLVDLDQLPDGVRRSVPRPEALPTDGVAFYDAVTRYEKALLSSAMHRAGGVQKEAARLLELSPTTLNEMLKRHGMVTRRSPRAAEPEPA